MSGQDHGASASADRAGGLRPEPASQSQPKALIPSANPRWNSRKQFPCSECGRWFVSAFARADHAAAAHGLTLERPATKTRWGDLKRAAHEAFDQLWQGGFMTRTQAYDWLAEQFNWPRQRAHIGVMRPRELHRVIELASAMSASGQDPQGLGAKPASAAQSEAAGDAK